MSSFKFFNSFSHQRDIEIIPGEKIFIRPSCTLIPRIKILRNFYKVQNLNIIRKGVIKHLAVIQIFSFWKLLIILLFLLYFWNTRSQIQWDDIAHCTDPLTSSPCPGVASCSRSWLFNQTHCMHRFEDKMLNSLVIALLVGHGIIVHA